MSERRDPPLTAADGAAETELHGAAWCGDLDAVRALIASGVDPNLADSIGETPLHGAAASGHAQVVAYFLSVGARHDVHETTAGLTPLHWAASHGDVETLRTLVEAGADPCAENHAGALAVDLAHRYGKGANVAYLKSIGPPIASRRR